MNEFIDRPYLKNKDIAKLLGTSRSTVSKMVKEYGLQKWPWGYSTDEIIQKFNLKAYVNRQKKKAPTPTKVESAQKVDM